MRATRAGPRRQTDEHGLIAGARAGDQEAFRRLTEPYIRELHVHCYRMLGSLHDAEDVLQEVMLRAWRHLKGFEGQGSFRAWLYRIATNRCLTGTVRARAQRAGGPELQAPPPPPNAPDVEVVPLEPYPDALLDQLEENAESPAGRFELGESVQLAFLAVVRLLPPRQRAVLLLRDVLDWSAGEVAELLDSSVASVNSALQRARATLDRHRRAGRLPFDRQAPRATSNAPSSTASSRPGTRSISTGSWRSSATTHSSPCRVPARLPRATGDRRVLRHGPGGGCARPHPVGAHPREPPARGGRVRSRAVDGTYEAYGLMVLTLDGEAVAEITGFADPRLFPHFGLPDRLAG